MLCANGWYTYKRQKDGVYRTFNVFDMTLEYIKKGRSHTAHSTLTVI